MWYVYFLELGNSDIYVSVETEKNVRDLVKYFKSGSGKAFAKKRFF
jgi:hypothetical protein